MSQKAIILSSGGVDSTTCIALAVSLYGKDNVKTVSVFYGQKHKKELVCARSIAEYYNLEHYEFDIKSIMQYSNCSLLSFSNRSIIHKSYEEQIHENGEGKVSTYVPFRNGLILSICASFAQSIYPDDDVLLYIGAHADDAAGNAYADCSINFIEAMNKAVSIGTYGKVHIIAPFAGKSKKNVVAIGLEHHVPYELTWSCYEGGDVPCRECATCIDRAKAFSENGVDDPAFKISLKGKSHA